MRLCSFRAAAEDSFGLVLGGGVIDLKPRLKMTSLKALLVADRLGEAAAFAKDPADYSLSEIEYLPVIPDPAHIWCLATNYHEHIDEVRSAGIARDVPEKPAVFMRYPDTMVGHGQPLVKPKASNEFDYEGELAVVIGRGGRHISEGEAMFHIAGYCAFNDGSVRDWQRHTRQIAPGKNFHATASLGPWLVTRDEIPDPDALSIRTRLNGETLQDGTTRDMIHKIPAFIAYVSTMLDLETGDILATGTPSGVGFTRRPPIFMRGGDICEIEIEGVGVLSNPIVAE